MTEETAAPPRRRSRNRNSAGPTVADVGRAAGVAPMTVSRVVNGNKNVLDSTREKVERAIADLGYIPNSAARSLAVGRRMRIALIHANPSAAYLSEFMVGSMAGAASSDAQLAVEHWDGPQGTAELIRRLRFQRIDGALLPPPLSENGALMDALHCAGIAFAQVATGRPRDDADVVMIDDVAAARVITERLVSAGHRWIGFIAGDDNLRASARRRMGFEQALRDADVRIDASLMESGDFTYRSGLTAADRLLSLSIPPTAVFASNDDMAAAVVAVAHRRGLDVPGELSVCGFDDTAIATTIWPELTTVRQPIAEMARLAVAALIRRVGGEGGPETEPVRCVLPFEIVERGSVGSRNFD